MENKTLENAVDISGAELKNSPIDNSETGTVNNYYNNVESPGNNAMQAQLDRIEQTLNFILQAFMSKK